MSPATAELPAAETDEAPEEDLVNGLPREHFESLNPCRVCGVNSDEGPEGAHHSSFGHCWKCGYRPGVTPTAHIPMAQTGLTSAQIDRLTTELRKGVVADLLEALRGGAKLDEITADYIPPPAADEAPPTQGVDVAPEQ